MSEAKEISPQVMEEALKAWQSPDFGFLRKSAKEVYAEWAVEDFDGQWTIRVGRFDLLLKTEKRWVILDYKTGRPERDASEIELDRWLESQVERYRPQLHAYTQMVAKTLRLPQEKIEWAMLFTALPRLVWPNHPIPPFAKGGEGGL